MNATIVHREDGGFELHEWPAWAARVIEEMAVLAGPDVPDDRARARLFPVALDEPDAAAEWRRNVHPDLFALFASAQEIVTRDHTAAERDADGAIVLLSIPAAHVPAWIAAINAARLHLGAAHDVDAAAMESAFEDLADDVRPAVVRIEMLGELQYHLIRAVDPPEVPPRAAPRNRATKRKPPVKRGARAATKEPAGPSPKKRAKTSARKRKKTKAKQTKTTKTKTTKKAGARAPRKRAKKSGPRAKRNGPDPGTRT